MSMLTPTPTPTPMPMPIPTLTQIQTLTLTPTPTPTPMLMMTSTQRLHLQSCTLRPFDVVSLSIAGDILSVTVEYLAAARPTTGALLVRFLAQSLPPKATLNLSHNANDDARDNVVETLPIDVSSITDDAAEHYPATLMTSL